MQVLWIISFGFLFLYIIRILTYHSGWKKLQTGQHTMDEYPMVSIVIPVRNEGENIGWLMEDLAAQDYPSDKYEVIIVDDHSSDNTRSVIETFLNRNLQIRLLSLSTSETGKKAALQKGIEAAVHPLILNTDGDCRASSGWISEMATGFMDQEVRMVIATVFLESLKGISGSLQSLELFSHTAIAAGSAGLQNPILCHAANMAYRKEDYFDFIGSHKKVSESGDDIFLLLWLKKNHPGSIRFTIAPDAVIRTHAASTPSEFFIQRMRWTSKSRYYRDIHIISTALLIFGLNIFLTFLLISCFLKPDLLILFLGLLAGKSLTDLILLLPVLRHYRKTLLLWYFLPLELVYFMYVSFTGIFGQILSISWKGRKLDASRN